MNVIVVPRHIIENLDQIMAKIFPEQEAIQQHVNKYGLFGGDWSVPMKVLVELQGEVSLLQQYLK